MKLEKLGTVGAMLAAILCPICFPKHALIVAMRGCASCETKLPVPAGDR